MGPFPSGQPARSKRGRPADETKKQEKDKGLYHCDYCHKDLSNVPRIKCAVCSDFDLCLECFSVGAQIWPHSNDHDYRVVDNLSFPLYHPEWGADEELLLLEAIDMYGLGNWGPDPVHRISVADHVGTKGGPECKRHYYSVYVDTDTFPLPKAAPEMEGVDIHKLIEEHRSSGQQRMTVQGRGGLLPPPKKARPAQHAQQLPGLGVAPGVKPEDSGAGSVPLGQTAVRDSSGGGEATVKLEPLGSGPMEVDGEGGGAQPAAQLPAPAQQGGIKVEEGEGVAGPGPGDPAGPQVQAGGKGRKHAREASATAPPNTAAAAEGAQGREPPLQTANSGEAAAPHPTQSVAAPPEAPHTTTATFGLRLRAPSIGDDLAAGGRGLSTPRGLTPLGPGALTQSPAEGKGAVGAGGKLGAGGAVVGASDAQQTGYHVKRNEFEPQYDNEAETIVAELEFSPEDTPEQVATKLRLVDIYNRRLDERDRRKTFVLDRALLNVRKQQAADRKRSAAERELQARLRVFARYLPQDQFEALAEGMAVEARLRARIAELCEYRRLGLRTFQQVDELESVLDGGVKRQDADKPPPTSKTKPQRVQLDEASLQSELLRMGMPHAAASLHSLRTTLSEGKATGTALQAWRSRRGALLDITSLPDSEPLTQKERALCASERYLPAQYLAVKAALLKVQQAKGHVSKTDARALSFKVDPARLIRLLDFFGQQGWVKQVA